MSRENVEVVTRAYDAWGSSDFETLFALADEDIVCHRVPPFPAGTFQGHEGMLAIAGEWSEDFED